MKHVLNIIFLSLITFLAACTERDTDRNKALSVDLNQVVFVKATDPADQVVKYGAFVLSSETHGNERYKFRWMYIDDGNSRIEIQRNTVKIGNSDYSESSGIDFAIYSLRIGHKSTQSWYVYTTPEEFSNAYYTEICLTEFSKIEELNTTNLNECDWN